MKIPEETLRWFKGDELRARVFWEKYALRDEDGNPQEKTPQEMWKRVAREVASVEREEIREKIEKDFFWLLQDFKFIPGGRILFGAGNKRKSTLLNCYYIPIKEDSIEGIFDCAKEMARTYSYGGGVGIDITILRPKNAPVSNAAIRSTGAVSFMDLFSKVTGTIGQAGRRGALMITLEVRHPDVFDFIDVKDDPQRQQVRFANISLKITDDFMKAVQNDEKYTLWFENEKVKRIEVTVRARELWERIIKRAWSSAEPGVLFWTRVKEGSPTEYDEKMAVKGVNPCAEQPLEDYGACDLGNINLAKFVKNPFQKPNLKKIMNYLEKMDEFDGDGFAYPDFVNLEKAIRLAVRFLDNVLDYNKDRHPLPQQSSASIYSRRIGVGWTGLADFLAQLQIRYDSDVAIEFVDLLMNWAKNIAYDESIKLAYEKGSFPAFKKEKHVERPFIKGLKEDIIEKIWKVGLRNSCLLTIPPVGSGAVLAGTTGGIEPIFALFYIRRSESLSKGEFKVFHPLVGTYLELSGGKDERDLPPYFVTAYEISPQIRVRMQATIQKHIDSSISSTVNLPKSITPDEIGKIYFMAWELGCKGITVYREGSREGVLIKEDEEPDTCPYCESKLWKNKYLICYTCGISIDKNK